METAAEFLRVGVWAEAAASLLSRVTAMAGKKRNQYTLVHVIFRGGLVVVWAQAATPVNSGKTGGKLTNVLVSGRLCYVLA